MRAVVALFVDEDGAWVQGHPEPDPAAQHVLMMLAYHANPETGIAWPSNRTLAAETGHHYRTVQNVTRRLESEGYITRVKAGGGRGRTTRWSLNLEALKGGTTPPFTEGERVASGAERVASGSVKGGVTPPEVKRRDKKRRPSAARPGDAASAAAPKKSGRAMPYGSGDDIRCRDCSAPITAEQANKQLRFCDDCYARWEDAVTGNGSNQGEAPAVVVAASPPAPGTRVLGCSVHRGSPVAGCRYCEPTGKEDE